MKWRDALIIGLVEGKRWLAWCHSSRGSAKHRAEIRPQVDPSCALHPPARWLGSPRSAARGGAGVAKVRSHVHERALIFKMQSQTRHRSPNLLYTFCNVYGRPAVLYCRQRSATVSTKGGLT